MGSNPTGRTTSFSFNDLCEKQLWPDRLLFEQMVGEGSALAFSFFFCQSNCLRY